MANLNYRRVQCHPPSRCRSPWGVGPWRHRGAPGWMDTCISGGVRSTRVGGARSQRFLSGRRRRRCGVTLWRRGFVTARQLWWRGKRFPRSCARTTVSLSALVLTRHSLLLSRRLHRYSVVLIVNLFNEVLSSERSLNLRLYYAAISNKPKLK